MSDDLSPFEDREVRQVGIEIANAAGGLNDALAIDPREMHHGETVYVTLECEVVKIRHDEIPKSESLRRVHVMRAGRATILGEEVAKPAIDAQAALIAEAEAAGKGQDPMPGMSADEQRLRGEHAVGAHPDSLVQDCPLCAEERGETDPEDG